MELKPFRLFSKERGPVNNYRIPSIITADDGTVVACADARLYGGSDNPNRIEKVICRSFDNGRTWSDMTFAVRECGDSMDKSSAAIDPCLVFDRDKGTLLMLYSHTPAGVGILNSRRGTGFDGRGRQIVMQGKRRLALGDDGALYDGDDRTEFRVNDGFDVVGKDGVKVGNIRTGEGGFTEYRTSYMYLAKSFDNGATWTVPECISPSVKEKYMCFIGSGPGVGVQISEGAHKGRIVVPIYFTPRFWPLMECAACIYSDDGGNTWKRGGAMGENRRRLGIFKVGHRLIADGERTSEAQIITMPGGRLKAFIRNHSPKRRVAVAESDDGGEPWFGFRYLDIPQPICQISALNVKDGDREATLVLNAASERKREHGVIRLSYDHGETFVKSMTVKEGEFVYSCMTQMSDGSIGVLYEGSTMHETVDFVRFTLDDIKSSTEEL